jgi:iron only hydrogenase large subunit-like protein
VDFLNPVYTEKAECQDCYKCLRECPVKAIQVENNHAMVIPSLCVFCGHCVRVCPAGAKRMRDDIPRVKRLLASGKKVIVSLAPSFYSELSDTSFGQMYAALKKLGFYAVSETAYGADLVSRETAGQLCGAPSEGRRVTISSACPTVVEYIHRYKPHLTQYLSPLPSPLLAHARVLKREYPDCAVVFIGPCIAKKRESDLFPQDIDVSLSYVGLKRLLDEFRIHPEELEPDPAAGFLLQPAAKGRLYPVDGGMISSVKRYGELRDVRFMAFSGFSEIDAALCDIESYSGGSPVFLELLACRGGCVNGPCSSRRVGAIERRDRVLRFAEKAAERSASPYRELGAMPWPDGPGQGREHGSQEVLSALRLVGKETLADELNCGSCGYDTCRAFAMAILEGKAERTMCVSFMRKLAQKKADGLIRAIPSGVVIVDKKLKIIESNLAFARLMGDEVEELFALKYGLEGADLRKVFPFAHHFDEVMDESSPDIFDHDLRCGNKVLHATIFSIEKNGYAGGVFQDVTTPWVRTDRVISQARNVIRKNAQVVQKIAYLLGENAAETETILNSMIESFANGDSPESDKRGK